MRKRGTSEPSAADAADARQPVVEEPFVEVHAYQCEPEQTQAQPEQVLQEPQQEQQQEQPQQEQPPQEQEPPMQEQVRDFVLFFYYIPSLTYFSSSPPRFHRSRSRSNSSLPRKSKSHPSSSNNNNNPWKNRLPPRPCHRNK